VNLCRSCTQDFAGVGLFDAHRTGAHSHLWSVEREDGRRCLSPDELEARGWRLDSRGRWSDPAEVERGMKALRGSDVSRRGDAGREVALASVSPLRGVSRATPTSQEAA